VLRDGSPIRILHLLAGDQVEHEQTFAPAHAGVSDLDGARANDDVRSPNPEGYEGFSQKL
jgi:hypothetical protein